jgi:hypothetical protein
MAAGAIPPPLFFEISHFPEANFAQACLLADNGQLERTPETTTPASISRLNGRRAQTRPSNERSPPKDI